MATNNMTKDGHSLSAKDLAVDLTNEIPEDEKQKSAAKLADMKMSICTESSGIKIPIIKKMKKRTNVDECAKILSHVFNASSGKNKK